MRKLLFQENLKQLMHERGFTQVALSEVTGISQSAVSLYLTGKTTPKSGELQRMADALDVSMDYLWRQSGTSQTQENSYWKKKYEETEKELMRLREALKLLISNVSK